MLRATERRDGIIAVWVDKLKRRSMKLKLATYEMNARVIDLDMKLKKQTSHQVEQNRINLMNKKVNKVKSKCIEASKRFFTKKVRYEKVRVILEETIHQNIKNST